jgi:hypothetical protein
MILFATGSSIDGGETHSYGDLNMSLAIECESCGMPMASREEHGAQNPDNPYCIHCTDLKRRLLQFEEQFEDMVNFGDADSLDDPRAG